MTQSFTIPDTISEEYIRNLNWREFELFVSDSNFAHGKHPVCLDKSA